MLLIFSRLATIFSKSESESESELFYNGARLYLREKHEALRQAMNANIHTTPSDLDLSPTLALLDSSLMETPYLAAVDTLRMIADVVSPSAKLNVIGMHIICCCIKTTRAMILLG